jgi:hypothetical protein
VRFAGTGLRGLMAHKDIRELNKNTSIE